MTIQTSEQAAERLLDQAESRGVQLAFQSFEPFACKLCDEVVKATPGDRKRHLREHRAELKQIVKDRQRDAARRKREEERLLRENRRALG